MTTPTTPKPQTTNSTSVANSTLFWGHNGGWWDTGVVLSLVCAILVAMGVALFTAGAVTVHKREAKAAEDALDRYKVEAGTKIAASNATAEGAKADAAGAHALGVKSQADLVTAQAAIADAEARALEAGERTEKLRAINVRMQTALMPRELVMQSRNGDEVIRSERFREVEKYKGTLVLIQSVPDFEAKTLANGIANTLNRAGWTAVVTEESVSHIPSGLIWEGVQLLTLEPSPWSGMRAGETPKMTQHPLTRAGEAANAAANLLSLDLGPPLGPPLTGVSWRPQFAEEWARSWLLEHGFAWPEGSVVVLVGLKPLNASMQGLNFEAAQIGVPEPKAK